MCSCLQEVDEGNTECGMGTRLVDPGATGSISDDESDTSLLTPATTAASTAHARTAPLRRRGQRGHKCHSEVDIRKSFEEFSRSFCGTSALKRTGSGPSLAVHDVTNNNVVAEDEAEVADEVDDQVGSLIVGGVGGKLMGGRSQPLPMVELRKAGLSLRSSIL